MTEHHEVTEFKNRLADTVKKVTCDLPSVSEGMAYAEQLHETDRLGLIKVLLGEMHQLKQAVLSQK